MGLYCYTPQPSDNATGAPSYFPYSPLAFTIFHVATSPLSFLAFSYSEVADLQHLEILLSVPASHIIPFSKSDAESALIVFALDHDLHLPLSACFGSDKVHMQVSSLDGVFRSFFFPHLIAYLH